MRAQHPALTIAVEKLRTATTREAAQAARAELSAAIVECDLHVMMARRWARMARFRSGGRTFDVREAEHEALICLIESPQVSLPPLGGSFCNWQYRRLNTYLNHWLVNQHAPVEYGENAARRWYGKPAQAGGVALGDVSPQVDVGPMAARAIAMLHGFDAMSRPVAEPAPLSCGGCEGSEVDARGRCQRCRLRRRV